MTQLTTARTGLSLLFALVLAALVALPLFANQQSAPADTPTPAPIVPTATAHEIEGDAELGEWLAGECTTCHQRDGRASGIPAIAGWPEESFIDAMIAYREGARPHAGMQTVARRLNDEDIAALAAYFASLAD